MQASNGKVDIQCWKPKTHHDAIRKQHSWEPKAHYSANRKQHLPPLPMLGGCLTDKIEVKAITSLCSNLTSNIWQWLTKCKNHECCNVHNNQAGMHFISSNHQRCIEDCHPQDSRSGARTFASADSWVGTAVCGCFHWWYLSHRIIQTCVTSNRNHSGRRAHTTGLQLSSRKSHFKSPYLSRNAMTQL